VPLCQPPHARPTFSATLATPPDMLAARLLRGKGVVYITLFPLSNHSPAFRIYFLLPSRFASPAPRPSLSAVASSPARFLHCNTTLALSLQQLTAFADSFACFSCPLCLMAYCLIHVLLVDLLTVRRLLTAYYFVYCNTSFTAILLLLLRTAFAAYCLLPACLTHVSVHQCRGRLAAQPVPLTLRQAQK